MKIQFSPQRLHGGVIISNDQNSIIASIQVIPSLSNCKLAYLENIGNLTTAVLTDAQKIEVINTLKTNLYNRNLLITSISPVQFQWLKDNFEYYYAVEVPVGYGTRSQYHILLKNNQDPRPPIKLKEPVLNKPKILNIIKNSFEKTKRRENRLKLIEEDLNKEKLLE